MTKFATPLALAGRVGAVGCALAALGAELGYRFGWWHCRTGITAWVPYDQRRTGKSCAVDSRHHDRPRRPAQVRARRSAAQGRIESTATSLLFGFKDDVIGRIADDAGGTKVDVRSKPRVGHNDFGMNAKRIHTFQAKLQPAAG